MPGTSCHGSAEAAACLLQPQFITGSMQWHVSCVNSRLSDQHGDLY